MLLSLLQFFATKFLVLALHLEAGSFPKPLTAREEIETSPRCGRETALRGRNSSGTICGWWPMWRKNTTPSPATKKI